MFVICSYCRTPLQLPPGPRYFRCPVCHAFSPRASSPQAPPGALSFVRCPKKAVICGIAYRNTKHELKGCINDAKCIKYLLTHKFKFPESSILMLTDEEVDHRKLPTNQNIRLALNWLVQGCQPGDSLVFHFAGHGSQQRDHTGEEVDGYNETIWPLDYKTQGVILDDEINNMIVKPLPRGVKLHAVIDACHSGTVLDLPFLCRMNRRGQYAWEDHRPRSGAWCGTSGGMAISFSGCDDDQKAADTKALSKVTITGAMTYSFIQAIEQGHGATYGSMLNSMRSAIWNANGDDSGEIVTSLLSMLSSGGNLGKRLTQEPQLSASECFDVYAMPFSL